MKEKFVLDGRAATWFKKDPRAQTTLGRCEICGKYYKPSIGHKCNCRTNTEEVK